MVRLQVTLTPDEADMLAKWAAKELRDPREQIRYLVRQELIKQHDLLPAEPPTNNEGRVLPETVAAGTAAVNGGNDADDQ